VLIVSLAVQRIIWPTGGRQTSVAAGRSHLSMMPAGDSAAAGNFGGSRLLTSRGSQPTTIHPPLPNGTRRHRAHGTNTQILALCTRSRAGSRTDGAGRGQGDLQYGSGQRVLPVFGRARLEKPQCLVSWWAPMVRFPCHPCMRLCVTRGSGIYRPETHTLWPSAFRPGAKQTTIIGGCGPESGFDLVGATTHKEDSTISKADLQSAYKEIEATCSCGKRDQDVHTEKLRSTLTSASECPIV